MPLPLAASAKGGDFLAMPAFITERLSMGTFYNPQLAEALLRGGERFMREES